MAAPLKAPEDWLTDGIVTKLLNLLETPYYIHGDVYQDLLGDQPLLDAHVHALARALVNDKRFKVVHEKGGRGAGGALYILLYHMGGGAESKLAAPSTAADREVQLWTAHLFAEAKKAYKTFFAKRDRLKSTQSWEELGDLRSSPYELHLKLTRPANTHVEVIAMGGGDGGDPAPDPAEQELTWRLELELRAERTAHDETRRALGEALTETERAGRREAYARAHAAAERRLAEAEVADARAAFEVHAPAPAYAYVHVHICIYAYMLILILILTRSGHGEGIQKGDPRAAQRARPGERRVAAQGQRHLQ
jgi:hypothetical protein